MSCLGPGPQSVSRRRTSSNSGSTVRRSPHSAQIASPTPSGSSTAPFTRRARDVRAVDNHHSPSVIPFGITGTLYSPVMHMCASMGTDVPTWDSRTHFGDTNLLVTDLAMARDSARTLGDRRVALMRGHGAVVAGLLLREVVFNSVYLKLNAELQMKASSLGEITFLSDGEVAAVLKTRSSFTFERAWEYWCRRAGRAYDTRLMEGPLAISNRKSEIGNRKSEIGNRRSGYRTAHVARAPPMCSPISDLRSPISDYNSSRLGGDEQVE